MRGRVVALDTGLPLRRARVMLASPEGGTPRAAMTDADGRFSFDRLPRGRYTLHGSKPAFVDTMHGARHPGGSGRPIQLADGQAIESITLALPSAGVITGRVLDDGGDVMTGVTVVPMRFRTVNGERQLMPVGRPHTSDDTGTFRLFGLPPGTYYLSAQAEEFTRFGPGLTDGAATGFAPTYYPGTAVAGEAQPIELAAGAEVVADVQLVTARLSTVTGMVVDATGARATGGYMMVSGTSASGGRYMSGGLGSTIKADGTFSLTGLAPGEYTIVAQAAFREPSMFVPNEAEPSRVASAPVVVDGTPIEGLRLVVQAPIRIPVNVMFEDGAAPRPERVFISASAERGVNSGMATMRDGRLSLEVIPGRYRLSVGAQPSPRQAWFVKRVTYRGQVIEDEEVDLTAEPGARIDVLFTTRTSMVTGTVSDGSGKPLTDYVVMVFPEDGERGQRTSHRRVRVARPDQQGGFRAEHLPPGDYLATALEDLDTSDILEPEFLDSLRPRGKSFRIAEGGSAILALTLTTLP